MDRSLCFSLSRDSHLLTPEAPGARALWSALAQAQSVLARAQVAEPIVARSEETQWLYCQTSGSTGFAKTIKRSPASWIASFELDAARFGLGAQDVIASLGLLSHSLTVFASVAAAHHGADLALLGRQGPRAQGQALRAYRASVLYATPAQLRLLMAAKPDLSAVRLVFSSGGKLAPALRAEITAQGPQVVEIFGASETSYLTLGEAGTPEGSVGRAYPGVELRIEDADTEGTGLLWARSPYLFDGYSEGHSPETRWQGGWLTIGEMARLDGDGNLYLRGRRNRMVTVADKNVFPDEVELVLMGHPLVDLAAVVAVADAKRGHHIIGFVQGSAPEAELRQRVRSIIGDHAVPRGIRFVTEMPMLAAGKPDLQRLQRQAQA